MELNQLRYFVAVAESGTVSRAAARCEIAQPSLSQQLQKLERELGVNLFDRRNRKMVLTDAGRLLVPRAKLVLSGVHDIRTKLGLDLADSAGRLAIGAIPTIAPYLLPAAIKSTRRAFPDCPLHIMEDLTENLIEALLDGEIDCAILATVPANDAFDSEVIGSEPLLAAVPSNWQGDHHEGVTIADLNRAPIISLHEMHCLGQQINVFCQMKRVRPNIVGRSTQLTTILELVSKGLGISLVPAMAVRHDSAKSRKYLSIRGAKPSRQLVSVIRRGHPIGKAAQLLIQSIKRELNAAE